MQILKIHLSHINPPLHLSFIPIAQIEHLIVYALVYDNISQIAIAKIQRTLIFSNMNIYSWANIKKFTCFPFQ